LACRLDDQGISKSGKIGGNVNTVEVEVGLKTLDRLAQEEYETDFARAMAIPDEHMSVRRLARLTGIELKRPFAVPHELAGPSETGARREWLLKQDLTAPDGSGNLSIDSLKRNLAYETELRIYNELQCQGDPFGAMSFASFLQNNHSESNWFLSLLRAAQPYLCDRSELRSAESPSSEKRSHLWEVVRVAADDLATRTAEAAIEPVAVAVCSLIPFMAGAPPAVAAGLAIFLVHYAKKGYCGAKVQQEIVQTLAWRDW
jgi:hypothetical protein